MAGKKDKETRGKTGEGEKMKIKCFYAGKKNSKGYRCYNKHLMKKYCNNPFNKKCGFYRPKRVRGLKDGTRKK